MALSAASERAVGRGTRLAIGGEVALVLALAVAAVCLVTWLSERPGLRLRVDITQDHWNTLDPITERVLDELDDDVRVDLFLRPDSFPFEETTIVVQNRLRHMLLVARERAAGKLEVVDHVLSAQGAWEARSRELGLAGIAPPGVVVVSNGRRKEVLQLRGQIADVDPGNPYPNQFVPARVAAFRGEEALVGALLKVTQGARPRLLFSSGHGEPDIYGEDDFDLGLLENALVDDGFDVARWHGESDGPLPDDLAVLALIGPKVAFSEVEQGWIRDWLARGGRVVAAPGRLARGGPGTLEELVEENGMRVASGFVARPVPNPTTGEPVYGLPQCSHLLIDPSGMRPPHAITEPLRRGGRRIELAWTRSLEHAEKPLGTQVLDLLSSDEHSWLDLPLRFDQHEWQRDAGEAPGPLVVAMAAVFPGRTSAREPELEGAPLGAADGALEHGLAQRAEGRLVVIGSQLAFSSVLMRTNRDFLLNTFNWAASREFRVRISARDPTERVLDLGDGDAVRNLSLVVLVLLPGALLVSGLVTAWKRRR